MASRLSTFVLGNGCHGLDCNQLNARLRFRSPRLLPISCKMRPRNFSSQQRRQHPKKVSPERTPLNVNLPPVANGNTQDPNASSESDSISSQGTESNTVEDTGIIIENSNGPSFDTSSPLGEAKPLSVTSESAQDPSAGTESDLLSCCRAESSNEEDCIIIAENSNGENLDASNLQGDTKSSSVSNGGSQDQSAAIKSDSAIHQETVPYTDENTIITIENSNGIDLDGRSLLEETKSSTENVNGGEQHSNIQLEDLIGMIRNAEKNILLLNQARVRALEDLDKILVEKEDLQGQINALQMRLAETDARIKVAAQEKIRVEFLEDQLEKLKNDLTNKDETVERKKEISENETKFLNMEIPLSRSSESLSSLSNELDALRKENVSLKDDLQVLKSQLSNVKEMGERILFLEKERSLLETSLKELESRFVAAQEDISKLSSLKFECQTLWEKVQDLQVLLEQATEQASQDIVVLQQNHEIRKKIEMLEASLEEQNAYKTSSEELQLYNEHLQSKIKILEGRLRKSDEEMQSHVQLYQESVKEFQDILNSLKEESKRRAPEDPMDDVPWEFWSHILLTIDSWLLEQKISANDARLLREMAWRRESRIHDAHLACKDKNEREAVATFLRLTSSKTRPGFHVVHVAAEMAPVAKVGGLGDVVSGLGKALQKRGHLVEVILPKYDCMQYDRISDLKALDVVVQSYFDGQLFENKVWVGTVEGLPVYFIEPQHPAKFFWRGQFYGEHDDFKRFSFFSRAALELLLQAGKKPDIIHCHDWQTAFVAPLYWDIYAPKDFNSARICFTCHNFEYQGAAPASDLASCGLDVHQLNRPDRMQDNTDHHKVNPIKGGIVFSNIVTTVSPTYAQEVRTAEGGRGLQATLNSHAKKFVGILNGIDTDAWNPSADTFLSIQYSQDDLQGKAKNKDSIRRQLKLSSDGTRPLVGCITRLVPQKGVHLIRHAMYRTMELGGQFVLLGSSPVPHIQREFEGIASHFENHPHIRLVLKYDEALSHRIYAASDMFIIPSLFEPCGLTQMIAMRYGCVPIVRKTGGLNDSVFDVDDDTVPIHYRNGFTFSTPDEQGVNSALERAFTYYMKNPESWKQLVQRDMKIDLSWDSSAEQYEELYEKSVARARAASRA